MKFEYGCIGEVLKHSFSREIHNELADYKYELIEILKNELDGFMQRKEFRAINVTIPYKEAVIPYLYETDAHAKSIGAVNTVINRDGRLYGYNTDFFGLSALIEKMNLSLENKKVVILGTGGTSKTAFSVAKSNLAREIIKVSRSKKEGSISYEELYDRHLDAEVIINTTPVGMYPDVYSSPVDINKFECLLGVIDAVYNPLRSTLVLEAKKRKIKAEGGLYMLVAQAYRASEIFLGKEYQKSELDRVFKKLLSEKENIVLTGMPASGKSTVGELISKSLKREFIDTDTLVEKSEKMSIPEIFKKYGEKYFREAESRVIKECSSLCGKVIATGGGAVLRSENIEALKRNGKIYFLDRPLAMLVPTDTRPLSSTREDIEHRYFERYSIYASTADVRILNDGKAADALTNITEDFLK